MSDPRISDLKYHPDRTEETPCFSATITFNGKKYRVGNDGHGGDDGWSPWPDEKEREALDAWADSRFEPYSFGKGKSFPIDFQIWLHTEIWRLSKVPVKLLTPRKTEGPHESVDEIIDQLLSEGTWALPDTIHKVHKLMKILSNPLPASRAGDILYNIYGDDQLFDQIDHARDIDHDTDVRGILKAALRKMLKHYQKTPSDFPKWRDHEAAVQLSGIIYGRSNQVHKDDLSLGGLIGEGRSKYCITVTDYYVPGGSKSEVEYDFRRELSVPDKMPVEVSRGDQQDHWHITVDGEISALRKIADEALDQGLGVITSYPDEDTQSSGHPGLN